MNIQISVVIATYNRSTYLKNALQSLSNQSLDKDLYEIIVVDNGSTDLTKEVANNFIQKNAFNLVYIYSDIPSANLARNIGWQQAKGSYVAYLDDDAVPSIEWLEKILQAFGSIHPQPGVVGGKVLPVWEKERPLWLGNKLLSALSMIDYSKEPIILTTNKLPFSVNMAFCKELIETFGGFDLKLGRKGDKLISGDETALTLRIRRAGYQILYDPNVTVEHYVPAARLTQDWFIKRYYWQGYSDVLVWKLLDNPSFKLWFYKVAYTIYGFLRNPSHIFYLFRQTDQPDDFWFKCLVHARVGYLVGLFKYYNK